MAMDKKKAGASPVVKLVDPEEKKKALKNLIRTSVLMKKLLIKPPARLS